MVIKTDLETINEIKEIISQNPEEGANVRIYIAGMG